jgi:hypothetical protein
MRFADCALRGSVFEAKVACSVATTCAPSPTAAATRLIEPERRSPIAKIPRRLVSNGLRVSLQSPPVSTKPFASNATPDPDNQSVFGSAPMNKKGVEWAYALPLLILGASGSPPTLRRDPPDQ